MKKKFSVLLSLFLVISLFSGCAQKKADDQNKETTKQEESVVANVMALKGPTSMGMVKMVQSEKKAQEKNKDDKNYNFSIANSPDEVIHKIVKKEVDIAAIPSNAASMLYNKTNGGVVTLAINTLGILYVVENGDNIKSVNDLKGKTIYSSGKGQTPEYVFNTILKGNNIDSSLVNVQYKSDHSECLAALLKDPNGVAILPQPFVTAAQAKKASLKVALDLTKEWNEVNKENKSALITGVVVARKDFVEKYPEKIKGFLNEYKDSIDFTNSKVDEAAELIGEYDIVPTPIAKKTIPMCNITYIDGSEMKDKLGGYLKILFESNPQSIGGKMPSEDFYYTQKN